MGKILISSCLIGLNTRFNGKNKKDTNLAQYANRANVIFVCPEQLGGLPTPRPATEIEHGKTAKDVFEGNGKILTGDGEDQTALYLASAYKTLDLCINMNVIAAVLYSKSPSCGSQHKYDGTFTGNIVSGEGLVAYLLRQNNINVYDENNYPSKLFN